MPAWVIGLLVLAGGLVLVSVFRDPPRTVGPSIALQSTLLDMELPGARPATPEQITRLRRAAVSLGASCAEPVETLQAPAVGPMLALVRQVARQRGDGVEEYRDAPALNAFGIRSALPVLVVATGSLVLLCRIDPGRTG